METLNVGHIYPYKKSINYLRRELMCLPKESPYMLFSRSNNSTEITGIDKKSMTKKY